MIRGCTGCCLLLAAIALASIHPVWPILQCIGTLIAFAVTLRLPTAFPFLFPLLLVSGDAYPFTGQLVLQEYDSLLLGSVAGLLFRVQIRRDKISQWLASHRGLAIATCFLGVSVLVSGAIGIAGLPSAPFGDQLSVYFTQWNTLRIAKGYAWGILFAVSMWAVVTCNPDVRWSRAFIAGLHCAMVYVAGVVIVERTLFESWFDFEREYRATGPFFTMHIGDQHIDGFAAIALPFAWASLSRSMFYRWGAGLLLTVAMLLVAFMTMSRATVAALGIEIVLISLAQFLTSERGVGLAKTWIRGFALVGGLLLVAVTGFAIWKADAFRERFETVRRDWAGRVSHWREILSYDSSLSSFIAGRGIGTLPKKLAKHQGREVPPLTWGPENGGTIRFASGWPIYLERYYWPATEKIRKVSLDTRLEKGDSSTGKLSMSRCFKSMLHSYEQVTIAGELKGIAVLRVQFDAPAITHEVKRGFSGHLRPEALSMAYRGDCTVLITNGDESRGGLQISPTSSAPWAFTCDDHMVWRAKNAAVHLISEHGVLGLLAWCLWLFIALFGKVAVKENQDTSWLRILALISTIGFGVVVSFGTLIDTPWIIALLMGCVSIATVRVRSDREYRRYEGPGFFGDMDYRSSELGE